jgi:hypothetical protein
VRTVADGSNALRRQRARQATEKLAAPQSCYVDPGFVFADELGSMLDLDAVTKAIAAITAKAGVKGKSYSRRCWATLRPRPR